MKVGVVSSSVAEADAPGKKNSPPPERLMTGALDDRGEQYDDVWGRVGLGLGKSALVAERDRGQRRPAPKSGSGKRRINR